MTPSAKGRSLSPIARKAFKRSLFGYRPAEVDEAIAWRDKAISEESARADSESARADASTARSMEDSMRADVEAARASELEQASLALAAQVESLEQIADRLAMRVVERERQIAELSARLDVAIEALRHAEARMEDVEGVEEAVETPEDERPFAPAGAAVLPDEDPAEEAEEVVQAVGATFNGDVFDGTVEVEVGPLSDFGQLASFEDAASEIDAADGIAVKGFTEGRATLEMHLSEPIELLRELEERAPFEFTVRDTRGDRVVLDVDAE